MKISIEFTLGEKFDRKALTEMMAAAGILAASNETGVHGSPIRHMEPLRPGAYQTHDGILGQTDPNPPEPETPATDAEALEHDVRTAEAAVTGGEPPKRRRRTKAEIEADEKAAQERTLHAAGQAGLIPPGPPVPSPSAPPVPVGPPQGIVVPPGAAAMPAAPPAPPPGPPVPPQAPSMPAPPPASGGGPTVVDLREMQRSMQVSHPNLAFKIMKQHGFFTPEMVAAAGKIDFIMEQLAAAMAAA